MQKLSVICLLMLMFFACSKKETTSQNSQLNQDEKKDTVSTVDKKEDQDTPKGKTYKMKAYFESEEQGDYYYLTFKDEAGKYWDFGRAANKNNLSDYNLSGTLNEETGEVTQGQYVGKLFEVEYDSTMVSYYCCEGAMDVKESVEPRIVSLKLIETK